MDELRQMIFEDALAVAIETERKNVIYRRVICVLSALLCVSVGMIIAMAGMR